MPYGPTPEIIASWPPPNYDNPVSRTASIEAVLYSTTILMIVFFDARFYVQANQTGGGIGKKDWCMFVAVVGILNKKLELDSKLSRLPVVWLHLWLCRHKAFPWAPLVSCQTGLGHGSPRGMHTHIWPVWTRTDGLKFTLPIFTLENCALLLAKICVCLTYILLFPSKPNKIHPRSWSLIRQSGSSLPLCLWLRSACRFLVLVVLPKILSNKLVPFKRFGILPSPKRNPWTLRSCFS